MQRHERNGTVSFLHRVDVRNKRNVLQERIERVFAFRQIPFDLFDVADEFAQVVHPRFQLALFVIRRKICLIADLLDEIFHKIRKRHHGVHGHQLRDAIGKRFEFFCRLRRKQRAVHCRKEHGKALRLGSEAKLLNGLFADAPARHVDDPHERNIIVRVGDHAKICKDILDFLALIEAEAAIHLVGDAVIEKRAFQHTALRVHAVKDGKIRIRPAIPHPLKDLAANEVRLIPLGSGDIPLNELTALLLRPERLAFAALVVGNDGVCRIKDLAGGAVILLQPDHLRSLKILFKAHDVADIRAAPAIDALVVIADDANVAVRAAKQLHKAVLRHVGVLIFIHQHIAEPAAVFFKNIRVGLKQRERFHEQVVKIERIRSAEALFILLVNAQRKPLAVRISLREKLLRVKGFVFRVGDAFFHLPLGHVFLVHAHILQDIADDLHLVAVGVDGEIALVAQAVAVNAQHFGAAGMERGHPHVLHAFANKLRRALAHLGRRLVRERQRKDVPRLDAMFNQVCNAVCKHARFAAARARKHKQRAIQAFHSRALFLVQNRKIHDMRFSFFCNVRTSFCASAQRRTNLL